MERKAKKMYTRGNPSLKKYKGILRDKRGEGYVDLAIKIAIILALTIGFVFLAPIFTTKMTVDYITSSLVKTIELTGEQGAAYHAEVNRLRTETGLNPAITVTGNFSGIKINLREQFSVTVTETLEIPIIQPNLGSGLVIAVPVSKTLSGRGEVYWKP